MNYLRQKISASAIAVLSTCGLILAPMPVFADDSTPSSTPSDGSYTTTDSGDGTYSIPMLNTDVPDISVIRVSKDDPNNKDGRDVYYMVSTTMELSPGSPIMKSYDLVNWWIVTYVYDRISMSVLHPCAMELARMAKASGLRRCAITMAASTCYSIRTTLMALISTTPMILRMVLGRRLPLIGDSMIRHCILMSKGVLGLSPASNHIGCPMINHGGGEAMRISSLAEQFTDDLGETPTGFEGSQTFKIGDYFYTPTIYWGKDGRTVMLLRTTDLLDGSKYEAKKYYLGAFAQGSLVEVDNGDGTTSWHGFFFRDTYPTGRIPGLIPATWGDDGWPVFGDNNQVSASDTYDKLIDLPA